MQFLLSACLPHETTTKVEQIHLAPAIPCTLWSLWNKSWRKARQEAGWRRQYARMMAWGGSPASGPQDVAHSISCAHIALSSVNKCNKRNKGLTGVDCLPGCQRWCQLAGPLAPFSAKSSSQARCHAYCKKFGGGEGGCFAYCSTYNATLIQNRRWVEGVIVVFAKKVLNIHHPDLFVIQERQQTSFSLSFLHKLWRRENSRYLKDIWIGFLSGKLSLIFVKGNHCF